MSMLTDCNWSCVVLILTKHIIVGRLEQIVTEYALYNSSSSSSLNKLSSTPNLPAVSHYFVLMRDCKLAVFHTKPACSVPSLCSKPNLPVVSHYFVLVRECK